MHHPRVLEKFGCGPDRLRQIFTTTSASKPTNGGPDTSGGNSPQEQLTTGGTKSIPNPSVRDAPVPREDRDKEKCDSDFAIRKRFEDRIRTRAINGIATGISNFRALQAVDMAWDSPPIQKETYPLMLWAQGKVRDPGELCRLLETTCSEATARKFVKKGSDNKLMVDVPRICDFSINLVRSYVTRRHAALAALWDNLWPLLKYDPRGTDEQANLIADATTQRIDIMADEYNYRHFLSQCDRDKLLYSQSLAFPRAAWDTQTGWRAKRSNVAGSEDNPEDDFESYTQQEGVDFDNPHPSRWFWDLSSALANVNTNTGPRYIGHWGIVTYESIRDNPAYYNTRSIAASEAWIQLLQTQAAYFSQYFDPCVIKPFAFTADPALKNDRSANVGLYTAEMGDKGVLLNQYFEKINPKVEGIGDYDAEVWIRIVAAGDGTIVAAEFMPSLPACYGGINVNDNRLANASLAMEMLSFQDMASNIISSMIQQLRISFMMLILLDEDSLDPEIVKQIKTSGNNMEWWMDPKFLTYSATKLKELGIQDPAQAFKIVQAQVGNTVSQSIQALAQVLSLADRVVNSSPNELGQPNPREVSARETQEISTTVQSVYAFYNEGPREQRAAFKRIVQESLMCCAQPNFEVPVLGRYRKDTIEEAGFKLAVDEGKPDTLMRSGVRITGKIRDLDFDFIYTSRDGAERPLNTQGAQVLQQLFAGMMQVPGVPEALGKRRMYSILNTIARMAGAPDELRLELDDGESEELVDPKTQEQAQQTQQGTQQNQQAIQQIMAALQALAVQYKELEGIVSEIGRRVGFVAPAQVPAGTTPATNSGAPSPGTVTTAGPAPGPQPSATSNGAAILQSA